MSKVIHHSLLTDYVIGNFNYWDKHAHHLAPRWDSSGIWEGFIPAVGKGELYKYCIEAQDGRLLEKGDPFAMLTLFCL